MARQSLNETIAKEMGRDAFKLFTTDKEFKNAKTIEEICSLLSKRSDGKVTSTPPTVQKMIMQWISSNKCKTSEFETVLKAANESKGHKGKISYREKVETHYGKDFWKVLEEKASSCESIKEAINVIKRDTKEKVSPITFTKILNEGLENKEFDTTAFWLKWIPKKRKKRTPEEIEAAEAKNYQDITMKLECKKCGWTAGRIIPVFNKYCNLPLRGMRCMGCASWATLVADFNYEGEKLKVTTSIDSEGCMGQSFIDEDFNPIPNPFKTKEHQKEEAKEIKERKIKARW